MALLFHHRVGIEPLFVAQREPRPHYPTRGVANFKRDPESITCDSGESEFDHHADGEVEMTKHTDISMMAGLRQGAPPLGSYKVTELY